MAPDRAALLTRQLTDAVHTAVNATPRALQQADHRLGVSDLGSCREYARLMTVQEVFTDDQPNWKAFIGTAVGDHIEAAVAKAFPEARRHVKLTIDLPLSGARITGHPDLLLPNGVIDIKTTAELEVLRRTGPTQSHQFQRHLYYYGALHAGLIPGEGGWVANAYFDRTGNSAEPYVQVEDFRPDLVIAADEWVTDVIYAVQHGEKASKDKPIPWCAKACPFFSVCRAEDFHASGLLEDPETLAAVETYLRGREMVREGQRISNDAKRALAGVEGIAAGHSLRWIHVDPSDVPGFTRQGYDKIDVRPVVKA